MKEPTTLSYGHEAAGQEKREATASCAGLRDWKVVGTEKTSAAESSSERKYRRADIS